MIRPSARQQQAVQPTLKGKAGAYNLQAILWALWTLFVVGTWYYYWHADTLAQRPHQLIGLAVHCFVAGILGLIVLTLAEQRLDRWHAGD